ncbi:MAG: hypothetical protein ABIR91_05360 [Candidatus Saccharimonadales bacterium]
MQHPSRRLRERFGTGLYRLFGEITGYMRIVTVAILIVVAGISWVVASNWGLLEDVTSSGIGTLLVLVIVVAVLVIGVSFLSFWLAWLYESVMDWCERPPQSRRRPHDINDTSQPTTPTE